MAKQVVQNNDSTDHIRSVVLTALRNDPEVKASFRPAQLGMKSGKNAYVIVMNDGVAYRLELKITQGEETSETDS